MLQIFIMKHNIIFWTYMYNIIIKKYGITISGDIAILLEDIASPNLLQTLHMYEQIIFHEDHQFTMYFKCKQRKGQT